jgi:uncharacterized SAM-binding protein YcdF (DUF218 family)
MIFYHVSRLIWLLVSPQSLYVILLVTGVALLAARRAPKTAWTCLTMAGLIVTVPLGGWLLKPLEERYPRARLPAHIDGILVLGGGLGAKTLALRDVDSPEPAIIRLIAAAELARRYPEATLVFSGGNGDAANAFKTDTYAAHAIFAQLGLPADRALYEDRAHNTFENFMFSNRLVRPRRGQTWVLVTSAYHMPRAMAVARKAGWPMLPWPSDYRTVPGFSLVHLAPAANLEALDEAIHEWIGLLVYQLTGKAD